MGDIASEVDPHFLSRHFYLLADPSAIYLDHLHIDIASQIDGGGTVSTVVASGAMAGAGDGAVSGIAALAGTGLMSAPQSPISDATSSVIADNFSHSLTHVSSEAASVGPSNTRSTDALSSSFGHLDDHAFGIGIDISRGLSDAGQPRLNGSAISSAGGDAVAANFGITANPDGTAENAIGATFPPLLDTDLHRPGFSDQGATISSSPFDNTTAGSQLVSNDVGAGSVNPPAVAIVSHAIAAGVTPNAEATSQAGLEHSRQIVLSWIDPTGGITQQKINDFTDFIDTYKSYGVNTITLETNIPIDPATGNIESAFTIP